MDDMKESLTVEQMDRLFLALAILAPLLGAAIGALIGRRSNVGRGALKGLLVGLLGPANLVMWKVYNALTDRMGLDSVRNLLVQLGLFVALGVIAGLAGGWYARSRGVMEGPAGKNEGHDSDSFGGGSAPVTAGGPDTGRTPGAARTFEEAEEPPRDA
jgi:hypothetical protein